MDSSNGEAYEHISIVAEPKGIAHLPDRANRGGGASVFMARNTLVLQILLSTHPVCTPQIPPFGTVKYNAIELRDLSFSERDVQVRIVA